MQVDMQEIESLIAQCEANVISFDNDQMSAALHWGQTLKALLDELADTGSQSLAMGCSSGPDRHPSFILPFRTLEECHAFENAFVKLGKYYQQRG